MSKYNWLTENPSNSLTRQAGDEGAEEGANEHFQQEGHVLVRVGLVQHLVQHRSGNCREQIKEGIHLWKMIISTLAVTVDQTNKIPEDSYFKDFFV